MRDFTLDMYTRLLEAAIDADYDFLTFEMYLSGTTFPPRAIIMRHDVDRKPHNALFMARIEKDMGVRASYYFRILKESFDVEIIKRILDMGHEIGYHYEDLTMARGDIHKAILSFEKNLSWFRKFCPVKTICMHGVPLSKWDNRKIWDEYDYRDYGILGEPYYDLDFSKVIYLTDTGRCWNSGKMSVWDRVEFSLSSNVKSTFDIIKKFKNVKLPEQIMINVHPERWNTPYFSWFRQLLMQNMKNILKKMIVMRNDRIQDHR